MIGNLDLIIDIVSEKEQLDRRLVEVVAVETFKRLKTRMVHSNALSLYLQDLGYFIPLNTRLRKYIRENIKKVRKQRKRIAEFTNLLESATENKIEVYTEKLRVAREFERIYLYNLKNALIQLNALRTVWRDRYDRRMVKIKLKEQLENAK